MSEEQPPGPRSCRTARLIVLAKPPQRGRCKSRLAADIGGGPATRLARAMLRDVWSATAGFAASPGGRRSAEEQANSCCGEPPSGHLDVRLASSAEPCCYPLLCPEPQRVSQGDGDLGARMARLLSVGLRERGAVLLLGTDSPALPDGHLAAALESLDQAELVLGPCDNGGFWCLGLSAEALSSHTAVADGSWLDGLDWSLADTLPAVEARARELGLSLAQAPNWFDVDHGEDLDRLRDVLADAPRRAPRTALELARRSARGGARSHSAVDASAKTGTGAETHADAPRPFVSLIVSTLDEGLRLDACCAALAAQPGPHEIIVADGGSRDGSAERVADRPEVTVLRSAPGRGRQFAAGAALASGDILAFVHVDAVLPRDGTERIRACLAKPGTEAGAFVTRTVADPELPDRAGPLLRLADLRSRLTRHPYGDQVLFVSAAVYHDCGGFRPLPIMEDYDLAVRLARRARLARITEPVQVSGRRMQQRPLHAALMMRVIPPLYRLGVSADRLARWYRGR